MKKLHNYSIFKGGLKIQIKILLFLFFISSVAVQAQENLPVAVVGESGLIMLNGNNPISSDYQMDISHLIFESEKAAEKFFRGLSDGAVSFTIDFNNKLATMHLKTEMLAKANMNWDVNEWNKYFQKKVDSFKYTKGQ